MARSQQEHNEQKSFFQWTELLEKQYPPLGRFFAVPNGGHRNKATAGKLKAEGVRRGVPDVLNLSWSPLLKETLGRDGFRGLVFEFKSDDGRLSKEQVDWCEHLRAEGCRVEVVRSWVEAATITIEHFGLPQTLLGNLPRGR